MKRIVICADGTWNRPEELNSDDIPTNVLQLARAISPQDQNNHKQIVFYDWGIGSYHDQKLAGGLGIGLEKNVTDGYRFLVHNYEIGDQIFLFGFSRGAYTIRSLSALINNCGILKSTEGRMIAQAFELYKNKEYPPSSELARQFRQQHAIETRTNIDFIGAWDTVGAMGLPFTLFGMIEDKDLFFDRKVGGNVKVVRHALALDEFRKDFEPTIWEHRNNIDMQQVWFAGCHSDIGGSYPPDENGHTLSNIPLIWMAKEATKFGLKTNSALGNIDQNVSAQQNNEYKGKFKLLGKLIRDIPLDNPSAQYIHTSVVERQAQSDYASETLDQFSSLTNNSLKIIP